MTPIFSRSWLMKITEVRERLIAPASLRSAWLISRACRPGSESPMSPSISAFGTRAATESITTTSTAPDRTRISVISSPCSPVSGWETSRLSMSTPSFFAYSTSSACSASMYAAAPPWRWAFAPTGSASVVLPLDSGPKISVTRPRGIPPIPIAASRLIAPVEIPATRTWGESAPMRMMDPLPQVFSICVIAKVNAFRRSSESFGWSAMIALMGLRASCVRPEYIPKPALPPPGTECVFQMLQLALYQRYAIKAVDVRGAPVAIDPHPCRLHDLAALCPRHRFKRAAECRPASCFHFYECHQAPAPRNEIELDSSNAEAMRHDLPTAALEIADRLLFTREPALTPRVGPIGWIAVHTARHGRN